MTDPYDAATFTNPHWGWQVFWLVLCLGTAGLIGHLLQQISIDARRETHRISNRRAK